MSTNRDNENNEQSHRHDLKNAFKKYLIFKLNDSQYGVTLSEVKEVIGLPPCTYVPGSPQYFLGLINLRGKIITAIDLKLKLGISSQNKSIKRPAVIITEVGGITLGCVVDSISEVMAISKDQIDSNLEVRVNGEKEFIRGIARFQDRAMILLLDLQKSVDVTDIVRIKNQQLA